MKNGYSLILTLCMAASTAGAATTTVELPKVADALAAASAGDVILIASGEYSDLELKWRAPGRPVTVKAAEPGKVVVKGKSSLRVCGDSLTVSGLTFDGAHPARGNVMEFRYGKELANACRLTECSFIDCNPEARSIVSSYIVLHGKANRVDHCNLSGKLSLGVTLLVNLNDKRSLNNGHRIDHNYFGPRPVYGSNGAETMRIGTSQQAYETSATVVEQNYFERCNGEVEIISVKSSGNVIRGNVFDRCEGVVALRHGKGNLVEGNIFNGRGHRNTGGVRIVDSGHKVTGNTFINLKGTRFFSALALMNSVPNSLPNRYVQATDVVISDNIFIDCSNIEFGTGKDMERTQAPQDCLFKDNVIMTDASSPFTMIDADAGVEFIGNKREHVSKKAVEKAEKTCGTILECCTLHPSSSVRLQASVDTIRLEEGIIWRSEPYIISRPTVITGNNTTLRWNGSSGGDFITIADGGSLSAVGITFDGALEQGCAVVRNAIATSSRMISPYTLTIEGCRFVNMPESGCCAVRGTKGTFAETVKISDCEFADLSGNAISFADETDDKGRYNADDIVIRDCRFSNMLGIPVNIYRGGSDESTAGPYVEISDCTFTDCCNRERGSVLRLIGPQLLRIDGCIFNNSGRGGASIRLDETTWEKVSVSGCSFNDAGRVISNRNVITN